MDGKEASTWTGGPAKRRTVLKLSAGSLAGLGAVQFLGSPEAFAASPKAPRITPGTDSMFLSGTDKDHTVDWDFMVTSGRRSGESSTIPVPSNWELQGYGTYTYGYDTAPNERGLYRHAFTPPEAWRGKLVSIVFEGSMTDTKVMLNGALAGPVFQGGFYRFSYDVTDLLKYGESNLLEVEVSKDSANTSINRAERLADYWVFGGIFRPVYLIARPTQFIERIAVDARADGTFSVDVFPDGIRDADTLVAQIRDLEGAPVGHAFSADLAGGEDVVRLATAVANARLWTAETPNLYSVEVKLLAGDREVHSTSERFGFRTIEVRPRDGIYVNGQKIVMRGICRHEFWPDSGRTTSPEINRADILLMKEANINAVLMSHYPQDPDFYDAADELGLYVLDELAGWQKAYDTPTAKRLVGPMIARDVNHPSIIFWCNGNEGGWNTAIDGDFALYDPQQRKVLHPWAFFSDIDDKHYPSYDLLKARLDGGLIFMPTEFLHGLYDGGSGSGLEDYWKLMSSYANSAGGFLWAWIDEGVVRTDQGGRIDVAGNRAPDGITGPYRQKEGSYFTIKEIWSPIQAVPEDFATAEPGNFRVTISNRYAFTNTKDCRFTWNLIKFSDPDSQTAGHTVVHSGEVRGPDAQGGGIAPGASGDITLHLPPGGQKASDALSLTAFDPFGRELYTWVWVITTALEVSKRIVTSGPGSATATEDAGSVTMRAGDTEVTIDKGTGRLAGVRRDGAAVSFTDGPLLVAGTETTATLSGLRSAQSGRDYVVEADYTGDLSLVRWTLRGDGWLQLDYRYQLTGTQPFFGVSFSYPERQVLGVTWLGKGPYRVYKNRLRGATTDVWSKDYNDTATGADLWQYPEFKGYYADTVWAVLRTTEGSITVVSRDEDVFLRLLTPKVGPDPRNATVPYPAGDISFLDAIPAMGEKFLPSDQLGPQGQLNVAAGAYSRTLYFRFGK